MRIKKVCEVFLGGPKTGSKWNHSMWGKDTGFREDVFCLFGLRASVLSHHCWELCTWLTSHGNQVVFGTWWDWVIFLSLKCFYMRSLPSVLLSVLGYFHIFY